MGKFDLVSVADSLGDMHNHYRAADGGFPERRVVVVSVWTKDQPGWKDEIVRTVVMKAIWAPKTKVGFDEQN